MQGSYFPTSYGTGSPNYAMGTQNNTTGSQTCCQGSSCSCAPTSDNNAAISPVLSPNGTTPANSTATPVSNNLNLTQELLIPILTGMLEMMMQLITLLIENLSDTSDESDASESENNQSNQAQTFRTNNNSPASAQPSNSETATATPAVSPTTATVSGTSVQAANLGLPVDKQHVDRPSESGDFGERVPPVEGASSFHKGNDFGAAEGTPIYAAQDGTVTLKPDNGTAGNEISIDHNGELSTRYLHLSRYADGLEPGQQVKKGQIIGYVGSTGIGTGAHLHYEVRINGEAVDPWPYLEAALAA